MNLNPRIELPGPLRRAATNAGVKPLRVYLVRGALWLGFIVAIAFGRACAHQFLGGVR